MGCWNETCMLSHTPIFCGDKIYAGLIAVKTDGFDATHPDGLFTPVAPLVEARYDDYGRPECVRCGDAVFDIYKGLELQRVSPKNGRLEKFDQAAGETCGDDIFQNLFDAARHDGLYLMDTAPMGHKVQRQMFPVLILGRFWDLAQKSVKKRDLCLSGAVKDDVTLRTRLPEKFRAAIRDGRLDEQGVMVPHLKLQAFMDMCRIPWHFTCGSGSQEGFTPQMYALAGEVRKYRNELRDQQAIWDS
ncbi:MAG: hypothetical protein NC311_10110 [Muribaculaceae bacterium]|nr:hypothetical protein [Muribaculaceae bacterium]